MRVEDRPEWRRRFGRAIAWALALKLAALAVLWALFFSPAHRPNVTPELVESRLVSERDGEAPDD
jgi:hypothetical protein